MAVRRPKINLLLREDLTQKTAGRLLLWALTVGRYIAIFTELVVIAGVIARFTLDYQRNNITEDILEQQAILQSYRPTELRIRRLHSQLSSVATLNQQNLQVEELLKELPQITPLDMRYESLAIGYDSMGISGVSLSLQGFSAFLSAIQSRSEFEDIILESIESGGPQDPSIHFSLTIEFGRLLPKTQTPSKSANDIVL